MEFFQLYWNKKLEVYYIPFKISLRDNNRVDFYMVYNDSVGINTTSFEYFNTLPLEGYNWKIVNNIKSNYGKRLIERLFYKDFV
jgi:hypothetical protein